MNTERIRELAEQAGDDWDHTLEEDKEFLKKFAQLIVRECIQVVGLEDSDTEEWFKAKADSVEKIKQHFGIENEY
jgi:hypothetical protein